MSMLRHWLRQGQFNVVLSSAHIGGYALALLRITPNVTSSRCRRRARASANEWCTLLLASKDSMHIHLWLTEAQKTHNQRHVDCWSMMGWNSTCRHSCFETERNSSRVAIRSEETIISGSNKPQCLNFQQYCNDTLLPNIMQETIQ
jgi:hypothetical protein